MKQEQIQVRIQALIDSALEVFIGSGGYRRAKMSVIAEVMGVASGTVFHYVESKEALFDFALRNADVDALLVPLPELPISTPEPGSTLRFVRERVADIRRIPSLERALESDTSDPIVEFGEIVGEVYDTMCGNRRGMKLVDSSAQDFPEIAEVWFIDARGYVLQTLGALLRKRIDGGHFETISDISIASRMILETCTYWAVHRHWDPQRIVFDEHEVREMVIRFVLGQCIRATSPN